MKRKSSKKIFVSTILILCVLIFTVLQGYWAIWDYRTAPSSSCLDCDIFPDLLFSSILPIIGLGLLQVLYFFIRPVLAVRTILSIIMLIICWTIIDTQIFDEREASWSTYTNVWEIGIALSFLPATTFGVIFGVVHYFLCLRLNSLNADEFAIHRKE